MTGVTFEDVANMILLEDLNENIEEGFNLGDKGFAEGLFMFCLKIIRSYLVADGLEDDALLWSWLFLLNWFLLIFE